MSVILDASRLRNEMARRGWSAADLSRHSRLSQATVSAALSERPITARSLGLIAEALARAPTVEMIERLLPPDSRQAGLG
jgi:lambda repressor-like predicted transcriptional regulator